MTPTTSSSQRFLSRALLVDGLITGATAALMAVDATPLSDLLGLPVTLLRTAGLSLLPFAALLVFLSTRAYVSRGLVWGIVAINLMWTVDSLLLLASGWVAPTALGYAFTIFQAVTVAALAGWQYQGLRQPRAALA